MFICIYDTKKQYVMLYLCSCVGVLSIFEEGKKNKKTVSMESFIDSDFRNLISCIDHKVLLEEKKSSKKVSSACYIESLFNSCFRKWKKKIFKKGRFFLHLQELLFWHAEWIASNPCSNSFVCIPCLVLYITNIYYYFHIFRNP